MLRSAGRRVGGYECEMSWYGAVTVTGYGPTRQEASINAAALYRAAIWLCVQREGRA